MRTVGFALWPSGMRSASWARPGGIRWGHARSFHLILADDLPAEIDKGLVDVCSSSRTRLKVGHIPLARNGKGSRARHGTVFLQVRLVANEHHGYVAVLLDAAYLLPQLGKLTKRGF